MTARRKPPGKRPGLTAKQAAFVREYLVDRNATRAATVAGYSERTAREQGCRNLTLPAVAEAIAEAEGKLAEAAGIRAVDVLRETAALAFSDVMDYVEVIDEKPEAKAKAEVGFAREGETPEIDPGPTQRLRLRDLRRVDTRAVQELRILPSGEVKLKLHDKGAALDKIMRHLGLYAEEKLKVEAQINGLGDLLGLAFTDRNGQEAASAMGQ